MWTGAASVLAVTSAGAPIRRSSSRATTPAVAEQAAPTSKAPVRPSSSMSTNPAMKVPRIAPIVFAAYSCWNAFPIPA